MKVRLIAGGTLLCSATLATIFRAIYLYKNDIEGKKLPLDFKYTRIPFIDRYMLFWPALIDICLFLTCFLKV